MRHEEADQRGRRRPTEISRSPQLARRDLRHRRATAIREFEIWDRRMIRQHGPLYHLAMEWTLH